MCSKIFLQAVNILSLKILFLMPTTWHILTPSVAYSKRIKIYNNNRVAKKCEQKRHKKRKRRRKRASMEEIDMDKLVKCKLIKRRQIFLYFHALFEKQ